MKKKTVKYTDDKGEIVGDLRRVADGLPSPAELAGDWPQWVSGRVTVRNQFFERVPAELVTSYLTDKGALLPHQVAEQALTH